MKNHIILLFLVLNSALVIAQVAHSSDARQAQTKEITEQDYLNALKTFTANQILPTEQLDQAMTTAQMYLMKTKNNKGLIGLFETAARYAKRTNQNKKYIDLKSSMAQMLISNGKPMEAIETLDSLAANYEVDRKLLGKFFKAKGDAYRDLDDLENSEKSFFKGLSIAEEVRDTYNIGICYISLATLHSSLGNVYDAIDYNLKGLNILEKGDQPYLVTGACNVLSNIFQDLGNYEKAEEYAKKMHQLCEQNGYKQLGAFANATLGKHALRREEFDKALDHYELSLVELNRKGVRIHGINDKKTAFKIENNIAQIYHSKGNYIKANAILSKLEKTDIGIYPVNSKLGYFKNQIKSAIVANDKKKASLYLSKAKNIIDQDFSFKNRQLFAQLNKLVAEFTGDFKAANTHINSYFGFKDSIESKQKSQLIHNLEAKYQKAEQEKEISKLSFENEKAESKLKLKNIWLILGSIGLAVLSFLVFQFYKLYQSNKRNKEQLASQNIIITKALDDKNTLLKEIHHRVKNNLQVISSLLSLQSRYIKDEETLDAIKAGKSRVQSMSLLHQNLYRDDNLKGVEMNQYFQNLGQNLFDTYNIEENIQFTTDIDDITLDIDTVVPMGLITNELISNALKHAFKGKDSGKIHLSLKEENESLFLTVKDDGVGLPDGELPVTHKSLGATLIQSFAEKLEGEIRIDISEGSCVTVEINDYNKIK